MTLAERRLWAGLRGDRLGVRFRRQLPVGQRYIADFCAPAIKLIVEADGGQHADNPADAGRTADLEALGYTVLRVWDNDILRNTEAVLSVILARIDVLREIAAPADQAPPLSRGRGDGGEGLPAAQTSEGNS